MATLPPEEELFQLPDETQLMQMVREHWQKYRPMAFARLQQANYLDEAIRRAVNLTLTGLGQLINQRQMDPWAAWVLIREEWTLLPAEETAEVEDA
jgi:hypothetical protein